MKRSLKRRLFSLVMTVILILSNANYALAVEVNESGNAYNLTAEQPKAMPTHAEDPALTIYVATTGNDATGDGTSARPYASIEKARDHIRNLASKPNGDIKVQIGGGFYYTDHTIEFSNQDSGTVDSTIYYEAAPGATPIISGGPQINTAWAEATEVNWLTGGLKAYRTPLTYNNKLRAIYVDGVRAAMTEKKTFTGLSAGSPGSAQNGGQPTDAFGDYSITAGSETWAWSGTSGKKEGAVFSAQMKLSAATKNPKNIEMYSGATWVMSTVCVDKMEDNLDGSTKVYYQMPYAAVAQSTNWGTAYGPTKHQVVNNVYEWLANPGEFYFDQAGSTLYYIPRDAAEEAKLLANTAQVVKPELETIIAVKGGDLIWDDQSQATTKDNPADLPVKNITFSGLTFAYTGWNLQKMGDSYGYSTVQGSTVFNVLSSGDWHQDVYRAYDVIPSAIVVNNARSINIMDGAVKNTGANGIHYENNVSDFEVTGNYIGEIGGTGLSIGHPQHVYENDVSDGKAKYGSEDAYKVGANGASPAKEKFKDGTERVPRNMLITNNYFPNNCYYFDGNLPIVTYFTQNMYILHNFVFNCPYGGMNIGWGWCNFDGTSGATLPNKPSTTSRNNFVNFNRVEDVARTLQDTGCIYSLGQQGDGIEGGTDYSGYSEFNNNFLNGSRDLSVLGNRMVSGVHTDEGSAYINMTNNVMQNLSRGTYEFNLFARKHDLHAINGFANRTASQTGAPATTIEQYTSLKSIWPQEGHEIVLNSGLTGKYTAMVSKDVIPAVDYELASNVSMRPESTLNRRGLLNAADEVWIAPKDTTVFAESATMTKAAGDERTIAIPQTKGEYTMYIRQAGNTVATSAYTISVEGVPMGDPANVSEDQTIYVSAIKPFTLTLDTDFFKDYKLDGAAIENGHKISTEKQWTLTMTNKETNANATIHFKTVITDANKLLTSNVAVKPGGTITLASGVTLTNGHNQIWIAGSGDSSFTEEQKTQPNRSFAEAGSTTMKAPLAPGTYVLNTAKDFAANTALCSDATITVLNAIVYAKVKPTVENFDNNAIWAAADELAVEKVFQNDAATLAKGKAKILWDDNTLYVRVDVEDADINIVNGSDWLKDSVEVYLSEQNFKGGYSGTQGNQYRVTANDRYAAKTTNNDVLHAAKTTADGYTAFLAIPLTQSPESSKVIGFDIQINDATAPANDRTGQISWSDPTCNGYSSSAEWGELLMVDTRVVSADNAKLDLWLKADEGVRVGADHVVTGWENAAGLGKAFTPTADTFKPVLKDNGVYKTVYFDGTGGGKNSLQNADFKDYNGVTEISIITISLPESNPNANGDQSAAVWMPETGGWGGTYFTPGSTKVNMRLGSGATAGDANSQSSGFTRAASKSLTADAFVFDNGTHTMYENGVEKIKNTGKNTPLARSSSQMNIGGTSSTSNPELFQGEIAEVLIFSSALTTDEIQEVQQYVNDKYLSVKEITSFKLQDVDGVINGTDIRVKLPENSSVNALTPEITFAGASITPTGAQDFTKPVEYTVTAADGSVRKYTVTVSVQVPFTVTDTDPDLDLWLKADEGVTAGADNVVTSWKNMSKNEATAGKEFTPSADTFKPVLKEAEGSKTVYFDGTGGGANALRHADFKSYNDATQFSIVTVTLPESNPNANGDQSAAVWMPETGGWGGTYFTPGENTVNMRLGSGASASNADSQSSGFTRTAPVKLTTDAFVFDSGTHTMYENGIQKTRNTGKNTPMARSSSQMNIGGTSATSNPALFKGEIAEILIFSRALTEDEMLGIHEYINDKYLVEKPDPINKNALKAAIAKAESLTEAEYTQASWTSLSKALSSAKAVDQKTAAGQGEVDAATAALASAISALVKVETKALDPVNKTSINEAIMKASDLQQAAYTTASWSVLSKALSSAKAIQAKANASQAEINNAAAALINAISALKRAVPKLKSVYKVGDLNYRVTKSAAKNGTVEVAAAAKASLTKVSIPKTVKLNTFTFKVTQIAKNAFTNNKRLQRVTIGDHIKVISNDAFKGCTALTTVIIGTGLEQIGTNAFSGSKKLKGITIRSTKLKSVGKNALKGIHAKASINVNAAKKTSFTKYFKGKGQAKSVTLKAIPAAKKGSSYTVGNLKYRVTKSATKNGTAEVTALSKSTLTTVSIPKTVIIKDYTFKITRIAKNAFKSNKKIKKIVIGDGVKEISNDAFRNCTALTSITIGKGLEKIGTNVFNGSKQLKTITIKSTKLKSVGKNALKGIQTKAVIKVSKSKKTAYKKLFRGKGQAKGVTVK